MSCHLFWKPAVPPKGKGLPDELRRAFENEDREMPTTLNAGDVGFLRGVLATMSPRSDETRRDREELTALIDHLENDGRASLWKEC